VRKFLKFYLAAGPPPLCASLFSVKISAAALVIGDFIRQLAGSLGAAKLKRF